MGKCRSSADIIENSADELRLAGPAEERARSARASLTGALGERSVTLVLGSTHPGWDCYGRLLAYVEFDGPDVGAEFVRRGLAVTDGRFPCGRLEAYKGLWRGAQECPGQLWSYC